MLLLLPGFNHSCKSGTTAGELNDSIPAAGQEELLFSEKLADGFDFAVGNADGKGKYNSLTDGKTYDSWYIATHTAEIYSLGIHTGEDWNGSGGGNTDLGQPVYSIGSGTVTEAAEYPSPWGNIIMIEHYYLENGQVKKVYSQYSHLEKILVKKGDKVSRRQYIGTIGQGPSKVYPAHLHLEIRKASLRDFPADYWPSSNGRDTSWVKVHYESPSDFIKSHRRLVVPAKEKKLLLVVKSSYRLWMYEKGKATDSFEIALSQEPLGTKLRQGDLRLPEGSYRICEKSPGPFTGGQWWQSYLGDGWMKISYPNNHDAQRGLEQGIITPKQFRLIRDANEKGAIPPQDTDLGGGIGIHGWIKEDWQNEGNRHLTWGCVSMHNKELVALMQKVELGTNIIILK
jgi:murein DD-endopeptidase MepM/ murein hydrolase activator NlpD